MVPAYDRLNMTGRVIVVTGAGGGFGRLISLNATALRADPAK